MKHTDWAYLAGFVDGEGSFFVGYSWSKRSKGKTVSPRLSVANTNVQILEWILRFTESGRIWEHSKQDPKWKQGFHWGVSKLEDLKTITEGCLPYLKVKKKVALLILGILRLKNSKKLTKEDTRADQLSLALQISLLNKKGTS